MQSKAIGAAFLLTVMGAHSLVAQSDRAELTGRVVDVTGAVVPAVALVIRNDETGVKNQISTNDSGTYTVPLLLPGHYSISVSAQGFKTVERSNVELQTADIKQIDITLVLGATSETVTVTAASPQGKTVALTRNVTVAYQGVNLVVVSFIVMINLTVDALYAVLDPRIRY